MTRIKEFSIKAKKEGGERKKKEKEKGKKRGNEQKEGRSKENQDMYDGVLGLEDFGE